MKMHKTVESIRTTLSIAEVGESGVLGGDFVASVLRKENP